MADAAAEPSPTLDPASVASDEAPTPVADTGVSDDASAEAEAEAETLESLRADVGKVRDQLLRTAADFDNFRKRSRRELAEAERRAREDLLRDLLPVIDNLERAATHAESATDTSAVVEGIRLVLGQFSDTASRLGIKRIEALGQPFDPAVHEAVQHMETEEFSPGVVAAEVLAGYVMGDRLIRPSMVVVAKQPAASQGEPAPGDGSPS
jgi:molecular chaperone GrpE